MVTVTSAPTTTEQYLLTLRSALEALGPVETAEVVTEIRGLLAEAAADSGGDENAALAGFGSPEVLAARILEERGVLAEQTRVPAVPAKLETLAMVIDVVLLLAVLLLVWAFLAVPLGVTFMTLSVGSLPTFVFVGLLVAVAVIGSVWWLRSVRQRPGVTTSGMAVLGLRRIRVGDTTRLVRTRDIAGAVNPSRVPSALKIVFALLMLVAFAFSLSEGTRSAADQSVVTAVSEASTGAAIVSEVYRAVLTGAPEEEMADTFASEAQGAMSALLERHARGELASYAIFNIGVPEYSTNSFDPTNNSGDLVVVVDVIEYDARDSSANYQYIVRLTMEQVDGGAAGQWFIESVENVAQ
jgi:uncharacterized membrane protein